MLKPGIYHQLRCAERVCDFFRHRIVCENTGKDTGPGFDDRPLESEICLLPPRQPYGMKDVLLLIP